VIGSPKVALPWTTIEWIFVTRQSIKGIQTGTYSVGGWFLIAGETSIEIITENLS